MIPWRWAKVEELEPRILAFDSPNYLSRRLSVVRQQRFDRVPLTHAHLFLATVLSCLRNHVLPVFVFDGPPEHLKRKANPSLIQNSERLYRRWRADSLAGSPDIDLSCFASPAVRLYFGLCHIKDLCSASGMPTVLAPSEAEMSAAVLSREGKVGSVVSNDADALLFGASHVTRSVRFSKGEIERVLMRDLQRRLELDLEQMRDLAIICGCDFHREGIRGMGPHKGAIALKRHGGLEPLLRAMGVTPSEIEKYMKARDVFDEGHYIKLGVENLVLKPPVSARVTELLQPALGQETAEKRSMELLRLWKDFGRVQMTLEGWIA